MTVRTDAQLLAKWSEYQDLGFEEKYTTNDPHALRRYAQALTTIEHMLEQRGINISVTCEMAYICG